MLPFFSTLPRQLSRSARFPRRVLTHAHLLWLARGGGMELGHQLVLYVVHSGG